MPLYTCTHTQHYTLTFRPFPHTAHVTQKGQVYGIRDDGDTPAQKEWNI